MFSDRREGALSWQRVGRALYLPQELMGFAEGSGLLWLAGKRTACASSPCPIGKPSDAQAAPRANPYYDGRSRQLFAHKSRQARP